MPEVMLGYDARVPGNASRFFATRRLALQQPDADVRLAWRPEDPYIFNSSFDASLIRHDESYCTSVVDIDRVVQLPTTSYFYDRILAHLPAEPRIIDIGCGQGEFVEHLRHRGLSAEGYDPVLRSGSSYLHRRYWSTGDPPPDLYVMRCVLPHIADPWTFLDELAACSPGGLVLVEFQRAEWILEHQVWYQVSHDHVNIFRADDFAARHHVVDHGTFSAGEWAWVLLAPGRQGSIQAVPHWDAGPGVRRLSEARSRFLRAMSRSDRPVAVWGAAGKGIVLAHSLARQRDGISAIDADPNRWNLYLEGSGVHVDSPESALRTLPPETLVIVCNQNHLDDVRRRVREEFTVVLPVQLANDN